MLSETLSDLHNGTTHVLYKHVSSLMFFGNHYLFWAVSQCITTGHVVGKLPYVDLLPQTQLGEVHCVLYEVHKCCQDSDTAQALFNASHVGLQ